MIEYWTLSVKYKIEGKLISTTSIFSFKCNPLRFDYGEMVA